MVRNRQRELLCAYRSRVNYQLIWTLYFSRFMWLASPSFWNLSHSCGQNNRENQTFFFLQQILWKDKVLLYCLRYVVNKSSIILCFTCTLIMKAKLTITTGPGKGKLDQIQQYNRKLYGDIWKYIAGQNDNILIPLISTYFSLYFLSVWGRHVWFSNSQGEG